ncbi:MAG: hypothetical protein US49_C0001G0281 [candidate division TM6 bacterium GW2011_GWF2_37_49]|nr:MAG: hypothetical protein US49_C0001G0281 [candidate division TM6 bacterium GW2011_GWF2_37_49]
MNQKIVVCLCKMVMFNGFYGGNDMKNVFKLTLVAALLFASAQGASSSSSVGGLADANMLATKITLECALKTPWLSISRDKDAIISSLIRGIILKPNFSMDEIIALNEGDSLLMAAVNSDHPGVSTLIKVLIKNQLIPFEDTDIQSLKDALNLALALAPEGLDIRAQNRITFLIYSLLGREQLSGEEIAHLQQAPSLFTTAFTSLNPKAFEICMYLANKDAITGEEKILYPLGLIRYLQH